MLVLVMGHRLGLARALESKNIPYIVWSEQPVKNELKAQKQIIAPYPSKEDELGDGRDGLRPTHVIAAIERTVVVASQMRRWFSLERNPHTVILRCTDKLLMKEFLNQAGIPMTEFVSTRKTSGEEIVQKLGLPVVSKLKFSSGGRGVLFLTSLEEVQGQMKRSLYFEKKVEGTEGSIESLIVDRKIVFTNITEYYKHGLCNKVPAHYQEDVLEQIKELNRAVISCLKIKWGMTHLEYYITREGILFGEIALRPPGGYIMEALSLAYDRNFWELFVDVELGLFQEGSLERKCYSSSVILFPDLGKVKQIHGLDEVEKLPSLKKLRLKMKPGDVIEKRGGLGEDWGHALLANDSREGLQQDLEVFYQHLHFDMD